VRKKGRVDATQPEIVSALRRAGCSVLVMSNLGGGAPDIAVGRVVRPGFKVNIFLELKDGNLPPSKQKLTFDEQEFHNSWRGPIFVVGSVEEAFKAVGL